MYVFEYHDECQRYSFLSIDLSDTWLFAYDALIRLCILWKTNGYVFALFLNFGMFHVSKI